MWSKIIADCGDASFGFWALALLELNDEIELFGGKLSDLSAREWDGLRAVRAAISRRQAFRQYELNKPENQSK